MRAVAAGHVPEPIPAACAVPAADGHPAHCPTDPLAEKVFMRVLRFWCQSAEFILFFSCFTVILPK